MCEGWGGGGGVCGRADILNMSVSMVSFACDAMTFVSCACCV